jgi:hypothetical protein
MLPRPNQKAVAAEALRSWAQARKRGVATGTGAGAQRARTPVKSWSASCPA